MTLDFAVYTGGEDDRFTPRFSMTNDEDALNDGDVVLWQNFFIGRQRSAQHSMSLLQTSPSAVHAIAESDQIGTRVMPHSAVAQAFLSLLISSPAHLNQPLNESKESNQCGKSPRQANPRSRFNAQA